jgi:hypothetical protein
MVYLYLDHPTDPKWDVPATLGLVQRMEWMWVIVISHKSCHKLMGSNGGLMGFYGGLMGSNGI